MIHTSVLSDKPNKPLKAFANCRITDNRKKTFSRNNIKLLNLIFWLSMFDV